MDAHTRNLPLSSIGANFPHENLDAFWGPYASAESAMVYPVPAGQGFAQGIIPENYRVPGLKFGVKVMNGSQLVRVEEYQVTGVQTYKKLILTEDDINLPQDIAEVFVCHNDAQDYGDLNAAVQAGKIIMWEGNVVNIKHNSTQGVYRLSYVGGDGLVHCYNVFSSSPSAATKENIPLARADEYLYYGSGTTFVELNSWVSSHKPVKVNGYVANVVQDSQTQYTLKYVDGDGVLYIITHDSSNTKTTTTKDLSASVHVEADNSTKVFAIKDNRGTTIGNITLSTAASGAAVLAFADNVNGSFVATLPNLRYDSATQMLKMVDAGENETNLIKLSNLQIKGVFTENPSTGDWGLGDLILVGNDNDGYELKVYTGSAWSPLGSINDVSLDADYISFSSNVLESTNVKDAIEEVNGKLYYDDISVPTYETLSNHSYPSASQTEEQEIVIKTNQSTTYPFVRYIIPANNKVRITYKNTGSYGIVLTDDSDIVKEFVATDNSGTDEFSESYEFAPIADDGYLYCLKSKIGTIEIVDTSTSLKDKVSDLLLKDVEFEGKINDLEDVLSEEVIGEEMTPTQTYPQYCTYVNQDTKIKSNQDFTVKEYAITEGTTKVAITGKQPNNNSSPIMICFDSNNQATAKLGELGTAYEVPTVFEIPSNTVKVYVEGSTTSASCRGVTKETMSLYSQDECDEKFASKEASSTEISEDVLSDTDIYQEYPGWYLYGTQSVGSAVDLRDTIPSTKYRIYEVPSGTKVVLSINQSGSYGMALTDSNDIVIDWCNSGAQSTYTFNAQDADCKLYVSMAKILGIAFVSKVSVLELTEKNTEDIEELKETVSEIGNSNYWSKKSIWWCGTSIPAGKDSVLGSEETVAGNYPIEVGTNLNATVFNEAVGSSMCRANVRTGDYNGVNKNNLTSCLSRTKAEVEDLIDNYDTYKALSGNTSWDAELSSSDIYRLNNSSFEDKLLPYLEGTITTKNPDGLIPDLFVIDHGHNDFKYKLADNTTTDIGLEPTIANIQNNILAEDTFMTANNYERLAYFLNIRKEENSQIVGDGTKLVQRVGSSKIAAFAASLNRNCYIGAINFIVTVILSWRPKARIVFISNYEYENGENPSFAPLILAQESIAKSWAFPLFEVYKYLGFSNHIIPTAKEYFEELYPSSQGRPSVAIDCITNDKGCNVFKLYNQDGVHPHSDISGDANKVYAGVISEFIKTCR